MIYFFYDILLLLASLVYLPFYALRGRVHRQILMRFGWIPAGLLAKEANRQTVWIHAVSVGEARATESLLCLARVRWPAKKIIVSTVTPTGHAIMRQLVKGDETVIYAPLDISWVVRIFLRRIRPQVLVILETELWPNLIRLTKAYGSQVVIVNGRISDRSLRRYERLKRFLKPMLDQVDLFCMQTEESAGRIISLGAACARVQMTGNIKFDITASVRAPAFLGRLQEAVKGRFFWVAGSTHENEEEMLLRAYKSLRKDCPSLRLLIAPRHLERVDKIRRLVRVNGLDSVLVSRSGSLIAQAVMILDTIGDLNAVYTLADAVFVGGSLVKKGGHNPIEPALCGKPILFGPHMENFREIRDIFMKEKAAIEVSGPGALEYELRRLIADPDVRGALGTVARSLIDKNRGAAGRSFEALEKLLQP